MSQSEKTSKKLHSLAAAQAIIGAASCFAAAYEQAQGTYDTTVLVMLWLNTFVWFAFAGFTNLQAKRSFR